MNKIEFTPVGEENTVSFFVLEETRVGGFSYLLVTESEDDEAEAYILKDLSGDGEKEASYVFVEDDEELEALLKIFTELLEDVDIEL